MKTSTASKLLPKAVLDDIDRTIDPVIRRRANKKGVCSSTTAKDRRRDIRAAIAKLWELGFRIRKLASLKAKHVTALMKAWEAEGKSPQLLHNRLSMLRTLAGWLGKEQIVGHLDDYFPPERTRRVTAAKQNRAWEANGVDPLAMIEKAKLVDSRLAMMIALQHHFAMRVKESILFRPANAMAEDGRAIEIHAGTKGGRPRRYPIISQAQWDVFVWVRDEVAAGRVKRVGWSDCTFEQAQNRFYRLIKKHLGITKSQLGITPHGLRHGGAQGLYQHCSGGFPSPIEVAAAAGYLTVDSQTPPKLLPPRGLSREVHYQASMAVSRALGHNRIDVTPAYYGTYGHGFRTVSPPTRYG